MRFEVLPSPSQGRKSPRLIGGYGEGVRSYWWMLGDKGASAQFRYYSPVERSLYRGEQTRLPVLKQPKILTYHLYSGRGSY